MQDAAAHTTGCTALQTSHKPGKEPMPKNKKSFTSSAVKGVSIYGGTARRNSKIVKNCHFLPSHVPESVPDNKV